eukprot:s5508_g5.t1
MASEGAPGLGFSIPTEESFDMVTSMKEDTGEDYMMLETPKSSAGISALGETPAALEGSLHDHFLSGEALMATIPDELKNKTRDDLGTQLAELELCASLDSPFYHCAGPGERGFVRASTPPSTTVQALEKEVISIQMDKAAGTFLLEGWENVIPALPEKGLRFVRGLSHGEVKELICLHHLQALF